MDGSDCVPRDSAMVTARRIMQELTASCFLVSMLGASTCVGADGSNGEQAGVLYAYGTRLTAPFEFDLHADTLIVNGVQLLPWLAEPPRRPVELHPTAIKSYNLFERVRLEARELAGQGRSKQEVAEYMATEIRKETDIVDSVTIRSDNVLVLLKNWLSPTKLKHLPVHLAVPDSANPPTVAHATPADAAQNLYQSLRQVLDQDGLMIYVSPGRQLTTGSMRVGEIEECIRDLQLSGGYVNGSSCWHLLHGIEVSYFLEQPKLLNNGRR